MAKSKNSENGAPKKPDEETMTPDPSTTPLDTSDPDHKPDTDAKDTDAIDKEPLDRADVPEPAEQKLAGPSASDELIAQQIEAESQPMPPQDDPGEEPVGSTKEAPEDEAEPEKPAPASSVPVATPARRDGTIWPAVFGGVIAALLGFIAGRGDQLDAYLPASMQRQSADLAPLEAQTTALSERVSTLESASPDLSGLATQDTLDTAITEIGALETNLNDLTGRIDALEARPVETVETILPQPAENTEEIEALQAAISDLQARVDEGEARAKSEAERILAKAALTQVVTAIDTGQTFEPALGALEEVTPVAVPEALRSAAMEGVPSMAELRESFPDAARTALAASRDEVPESDVSGLGGFLRRQLSARSLTPQEGGDPDSVLSRAEAAVRAGNLENALAELDALPDVAKAAMQGWLDGAKARYGARNAAEGLSDSLTGN